MSDNQEHLRDRASINLRLGHHRWSEAACYALVACLFGAPTAARATAGVCDGIYEPSASYPKRSILGGLDVRGEAAIIVYVEAERALAEIDGCLYDLGGEPLVIDFGGLDQVTLLFELHGSLRDGSVLVLGDGSWVGTFAADGGTFEYVMPAH